MLIIIISKCNICLNEVYLKFVCQSNQVKPMLVFHEPALCSSIDVRAHTGRVK